MATPRFTDEIAEMVKITRPQAQEHVNLLKQLGVMTPTESAQAAARAQYLIDSVRLIAVLEHLNQYLLNRRPRPPLHPRLSHAISSA
jgi:predicted transcriptional regulator